MVETEKELICEVCLGYGTLFFRSDVKFMCNRCKGSGMVKIKYIPSRFQLTDSNKQ